MSATFQKLICENCECNVTVCRDSIDAGDCCDGLICEECGDFYCHDCLEFVNADNICCRECDNYLMLLISRDERREKNDNAYQASKLTIDLEYINAIKASSIPPLFPSSLP